MGRRNKKGSLDDLVFIITSVIGIALILLFFTKFTSEINDKMQGIDELSTDGKQAVSDINDLYTGTIDNSMLFLVLGLLMATLILAFLVVVHPIFFVFYFIMLTFVIFVAGIISNIYQKAASTAVLQSTADSLVMTSHILQWLPFIVGAFGFLIAIVLYKTWQQQ